MPVVNRARLRQVLLRSQTRSTAGQTGGERAGTARRTIKAPDVPGSAPAIPGPRQALPPNIRTGSLDWMARGACQSPLEHVLSLAGPPGSQAGTQRGRRSASLTSGTPAYSGAPDATGCAAAAKYRVTWQHPRRVCLLKRSTHETDKASRGRAGSRCRDPGAAAGGSSGGRSRRQRDHHGCARHPGHAGRCLRQRQQAPVGLHLQDGHPAEERARLQLRDRRAQGRCRADQRTDPVSNRECSGRGERHARGRPVSRREAALVPFVNDTTPVGSGKGLLVVRHTAAAPAVDVYAGSAKVISGLANGTQAKLAVPAGPCRRRSR